MNVMGTGYFCPGKYQYAEGNKQSYGGNQFLISIPTVMTLNGVVLPIQKSSVFKGRSL